MGLGMVQSFVNDSIQTTDVWILELHGADTHASMYCPPFLLENVEEIFTML